MNKKSILILVTFSQLLFSCFGKEKGSYGNHRNTYGSFLEMKEDEKSFLEKDKNIPKEGRHFIASDFSQKVFMFDLILDSSYLKNYTIEGICYCSAKKHRKLHSETENCPYLLRRTISVIFESLDCKVKMTYRKQQSNINDETFLNLEWKNDGKKYWDYKKDTYCEYENYTLYNTKDEPMVSLEFDMEKYKETNRDFFFNEIIKYMSIDGIIIFD